MHYSLAQCKQLAKSLVHPENLDLSDLVQVNLEHALPWPHDNIVQEAFIQCDKSKKKAALQLGLTRRCLRRRLKEIKLHGHSAPPVVPRTVLEVLNRLLRDETLQQIALETEISQAWICRMLSNLFTIQRQRYDVPDIRPRNPRPIPQPPGHVRELSLETVGGAVQRIRYQVIAGSAAISNTSPWFGSADTSTTGSVNNAWITFTNNSFTNLSDYVSVDYGDEEAQNQRPQESGPEITGSTEAA